MKQDTLLDLLTAAVKLWISTANVGNVSLVVTPGNLSRGYALFGKDNTKSSYSRYRTHAIMLRDKTTGTLVLTDYGNKTEKSSVVRQTIDFSDVNSLASLIGTWLTTGTQGTP